jgi:hypothetical protein
MVAGSFELPARHKPKCDFEAIALRIGCLSALVSGAKIDVLRSFQSIEGTT